MEHFLLFVWKGPRISYYGKSRICLFKILLENLFLKRGTEKESEVVLFPSIRTKQPMLIKHLNLNPIEWIICVTSFEAKEQLNVIFVICIPLY